MEAPHSRSTSVGPSTIAEFKMGAVGPCELGVEPELLTVTVTWAVLLPVELAAVNV